METLQVPAYCGETTQDTDEPIKLVEKREREVVPKRLNSSVCYTWAARSPRNLALLWILNPIPLPLGKRLTSFSTLVELFSRF